jgi:xanthine dehydrogenase accessory factor
MEGSVSGGCVEGAVVTAAREALSDGGSRLLDFGVSDDEAFAVGLACGGRIRVLVDTVGGSLPEALLADLVAARAARRPVALVADLAGPARRIAPATAFAARLRADRSGVEEDGRTFVAVHNPPPRLLIVGAVHIAQALVPMAALAGHDAAIIDPRAAFASAARFPGLRLIDAWPDEALAAEGIDARTAVVTLTHDPKLDDPAIGAALRSEAYYIGCLGSARTHARRVARLTQAGFGPEGIARIHAPVGLDIGARSPAEIAVAILAELTAVLRKGA